VTYDSAKSAASQFPKSLAAAAMMASFNNEDSGMTDGQKPDPSNPT